MLLLALRATAIVVLGAATPSLDAAQPVFAPARRSGGEIPALPSPETVGWVYEAVEVAVNEAGRAVSVQTLQATPGTPLLSPVVGGWSFRPAALGTARQATRLLVAGIFRPRILLQGPAMGSSPMTTGVASRDVPAIVSSVAPDYPPRARGDGVSVVEVLVGRDGAVESATVISDASGFGAASLDAARRWAFRPALRDGIAVRAYVYLVFGFREPVQ